jgi:hypothetical protein
MTASPAVTGVSGAVVSAATRAVRAEASSVFSASFAAFFPTPLSQLEFLGQCLSAPVVDQRLIALLLNNLSSFGASVRVIDALEAKPNQKDTSTVRLVL